MNTRLERILVKLANQHAKELVRPGWDAHDSYEQRIHKLVRQLADHDMLVIMGLVPDSLVSNRANIIQRWVSQYGRLYMLLAKNLFPSMAGMVKARYADPLMPPIVVLMGEAHPVLQVMAGFVLPYIARRQRETEIAIPELHGVIGMLLDELQVGNKPYPVYSKLMKQGATILQNMISMPIRQLALCPFDRPIFAPIQRPVTLPEEHIPDNYDLLPLLPDETDDLTPTGELFTLTIPLDLG